MNIAMSKIINLMKIKKFQKAELEINRELKKNPNSFDLNKILAMNFLAQEKYNLAMTSLSKCYEINPNDYDINVNLSLILNKIQDYKSSLKYSNDAIKINPDKPEVYHNIAHSYLHVPDLQKAELNILKSIELRGGLNSMEIFKFKDTLNLYTDILFAKGDEDTFKNVCIMLLDKGMDLAKKGIHLGDLFRKLMRSDKNSISQNHLKTLEIILEKVDKSPNLIDRNLTKSSVYSCYAEYYQKIDKEISENYYTKSNKLISDLQRDSIYQRQEFTKSVIKFFEEPEVNEMYMKLADDLGEGLIFIIGMPRSGTTLTESIIATSEGCVAGGEKVFFNVHCRPIIKHYQNGNTNYESLSRLGQGYLKLIDIQRRGEKIFIDKMPENYLYYKFIKASLPLAKFVHVYRDPWDNAISLFKQNYVNEITYASSFFGIALEYANYEHLMKKWKGEGDQNILDVNYQDLVTNTEDTVKRIWSFCNLSGQYDQLKRKEYFAQTASKHQVRQDIYSSSLKKDEFIGFCESFKQNLEEQRSYWKTN